VIPPTSTLARNEGVVLAFFRFWFMLNVAGARLSMMRARASEQSEVGGGIEVADLFVRLR